MSAERVLTRRELNRAVLARQRLLARARGSLPATLDRVGGIQSQYAPSMYIGLWSRHDGLRREQLTRALERRTVIQATLMRSTIHLVSRRDYRPYAVATREARRRSWLRAYRDVDAAEMVAAADAVRARVADGPVHRKEIEALVGKPQAQGVGLWIDLVRVPPSGTWERRRADLYEAADAWLGDGGGEVAADDALDHLVRRYLAAFGPATRADIASWGGFVAGTLAPALDRLELRRFRSEDGDELLDLPRAPLPDPQTPAPARYLPTWDATLLVHARRTGILPEPYRPRIFSIRNPHSLPTFLVDGAVAGTWRWERGRIDLDPFERLDAADRRALRAEGERLADLHR